MARLRARPQRLARAIAPLRLGREFRRELLLLLRLQWLPQRLIQLWRFARRLVRGAPLRRRSRARPAWAGRRLRWRPVRRASRELATRLGP
eukprot:3264257-Alexandrium_andersonii.AAC.1